MYTMKLIIKSHYESVVELLKIISWDLFKPSVILGAYVLM